jgi:hypothetical protein
LLFSASFELALGAAVFLALVVFVAAFVVFFAIYNLFLRRVSDDVNRTTLQRNGDNLFLRRVSDDSNFSPLPEKAESLRYHPDDAPKHHGKNNTQSDAYRHHYEGGAAIVAAVEIASCSKRPYKIQDDPDNRDDKHD